MANRVIYFCKLVTHSFSAPFRIFGYRLSIGFWIRWTKDAVVGLSPEEFQSRNRYQHLPLQERSSLRLLELHAGSGNEPLRGTLREAALDSVSGRYEALSWVWGNPGNSGMIDLGEQHYLPLRRNLTEVLHRIRHKQQPRTLWIDALCINQFDSAEQAQQLQLMADIYRGCKSVLVWLGIPTAHSALGMEFLSYLANSNIQIDSDSAPWNHFSPAESRAALQDILGRPYFQRLWVVQEAALAPRVVMQVGQLSLEWAHGPPTRKFLARLKMAELSPSWQHSEELRDGVDSRPLRELLEQSLAADARRSGTVEVPSLLDVIHSLRHRRVTDPRDQIYAAMSLASPAEVADLVPDYSLSWEGTYQRFFDLVERQVRGNPEVTLDEMTRVGG